MGNAGIPVADSFRYLAKQYNTVKFKNKIKFKKYIFLFIWLHQVLVAACEMFCLHCEMWTLSCGIWDLVLQPEIEPSPPALEAQSLSYWTIKAVPIIFFFKCQSHKRQKLWISQVRGAFVCVCVCVCVCVQSLSHVQLFVTPWPTACPLRLLCPWDFPGKNTGVGCYFLLQGIFPAIYFPAIYFPAIYSSRA